ncbi:abortive infection system antitoxin AbiGi family protein, partial [Vibrio sp. 10N.261.52.A1]
MRPGTVSKILWHFTGGPQWDSELNKQLTELKPAMNGYEAMKSILSSGELRTGNYHEIVKVIVPEKRKYNYETKSFEMLQNVPVTVKSNPVCCVADIPLQHLAYHAQRYGKIAIGFKRESIIKAGFNPVMYTLENSALLNSIYTGYDAIDEVDPSCIASEIESLSGEVEQKLEEHNIDDYVDFSSP